MIHLCHRCLKLSAYVESFLQVIHCRGGGISRRPQLRLHSLSCLCWNGTLIQ